MPLRRGGVRFGSADSSAADAKQRMEQIRGQIKGTARFPMASRYLSAITVSAGVAQAEDPAPNPSQLLRAADTALYAAKNAGRDRVMVYQAKAQSQSIAALPLLAGHVCASFRAFLSSRFHLAGSDHIPVASF